MRKACSRRVRQTGSGLGQRRADRRFDLPRLDRRKEPAVQHGVQGRRLTRQGGGQLRREGQHLDQQFEQLGLGQE